MRNPKIKSIKPNYRRRALEVILQEGKKRVRYDLPFAVFREYQMGIHNRFSSVVIDRELGAAGASFELADGSKGDFPADLVLYYCDPTYDWSPLNQLKRALKARLAASTISLRVLADALKTSPSQVGRILQQDHAPKQFRQLFQLADLVGVRIDFVLRNK